VKRIRNSRGLDASYRYSYYSASMTANYVFENGVRLNIWEGTSGVKPGPVGFLAESVIKRMRDAMTVGKCESGKIPVVLTPGAFASLLGIMKSALSAKAVHRGVSPFAGRTGEFHFNRRLSITDMPLIEGSPFGFPFDDEGVPAEDRPLIADGAITSFVADLKYARKLEIKAGNASRGYSSLPEPSFSNVVVRPGNMSYEAMLGGIGRGLLVDQFIGLGQSNTLTGDFSANLDLAYLIENGKISGRVKDCMLADNLFTLLKGDIILSDTPQWRGSELVPYIFFPSVSYTAL
jgi:PmbA protein